MWGARDKARDKNVSGAISSMCSRNVSYKFAGLHSGNLSNCVIKCSDVAR